jgi:hypothetical protein
MALNPAAVGKTPRPGLTAFNQESLESGRRQSTLFARDDGGSPTADQLTEDTLAREQAFRGVIHHEGVDYDENTLPQAMLDDPNLTKLFIQTVICGMVAFEQREELRKALEKAKTPDPLPSVEEDNTSVTIRSKPKEAKRRKALPDPEVLTDGKDPTFEVWEIKMREKLRRDKDDYPL